MKFIDKFTREAKWAWYGNLYSFGHLFLAIAIWNTLVASFNMLVMPRIYSPDVLIYMTPTAQVLPIMLCLIFAAMSKNIGLRANLKAYAKIGIIAFLTFMLWGPQNEAWLNHWGYRLFS